MGNQTTKSPFDVQILADRLKDLMRCSVPKVTQKDLASALGTAPNMVSAYMRGKSCPSLPTTPKRGRDPWRKMAVCNSCDWRRRMAAPCGDWDGTACMYTHETGIFRESPPTDGYCAYYKSRQR